MFSCQQSFTINGDNREALARVLNLALELSGYKKVKAFYEDKNGLVFCWSSCKGASSYPFEATVPVLVEQIFQYISNLTCEDVIRLAGEEPDIDGTVYLGWEIFYPLWYGENEIDKYEWAAMLAVRPCWIVYSK